MRSMSQAENCGKYIVGKQSQLRYSTGFEESVARGCLSVFLKPIVGKSKVAVDFAGLGTPLRVYGGQSLLAPWLCE